MNYEEFKDQIRKDIREKLGYSSDMIRFYPAGYRSDDKNETEWIRSWNRKHEAKESDILQSDIFVLEEERGDGSSSRVRFAAGDMYGICLEKGYEAAFAKLQEPVKSAYENCSQLEKRRHYETIREHLIVRPLNWAKNKNDLEDCIFHLYGDVALVLYQYLGSSENILYTSKIKKEEVKEWGREEADVMQAALQNTSRLFPAVVYDYESHEEVNFLETDLKREFLDLPGFIILSVKGASNGAAAIFYPGVMEKMMKLMGAPYYVIFMNTCDAMIISLDSDKVERSLKIASRQNEFGEFLSGRCYICDEKGIHVKDSEAPF